MFKTANMKRVFWSAAAAFMLMAASLFALGSGSTANASLAANCDVVIYEYGHNAPGTDTNGNRNAEFLRLVNTGAAPVNVEGWWVQDNFPHTFKLQGATLPAGSPFKAGDGTFQMPPMSSVYLYNGTGTDTQPTNTSAAIYRNTTHHFNNSGDTLSLKSADGKTKSYVQYTSFREKIGPLSCS
jgi:hypothetical protein